MSLGSNAVALVLEGAVVHKDQAVPRKSEGLPDRTAAAVQPLKEEKARLFAVVEGLQNWALLQDPWLWDTGLNVSTVVLEL